jgi:hypothetical protein
MFLLEDINILLAGLLPTAALEFSEVVI